MSKFAKFPSSRAVAAAANNGMAHDKVKPVGRFSQRANASVLLGIVDVLVGIRQLLYLLVGNNYTTIPAPVKPKNQGDLAARSAVTVDLFKR